MKKKNKKVVITLTTSALIGAIALVFYWLVFGGQDLFKMLLSGFVYGTIIFALIQTTKNSSKKYKFKLWKK